MLPDVSGLGWQRSVAWSSPWDTGGLGVLGPELSWPLPQLPSVAEPFYYLGYAFALVALPLLTFPAHRVPARRWLLDGFIVIVAIGTIGWAQLAGRADALGVTGCDMLAGYPCSTSGSLARLSRCTAHPAAGSARARR